MMPTPPYEPLAAVGTTSGGNRGNVIGSSYIQPHPVHHVQSQPAQQPQLSTNYEAPADQAHLHNFQNQFDNFGTTEIYSGTLADSSEDEHLVTPITARIDNESLTILLSASELFRETIVNMGIKLVSETDVYKTYFMTKNKIDVMERITDSYPTAAPAPTPTATQTVTATATPTVGTSKVGFTSW